MIQRAGHASRIFCVNPPLPDWSDRIEMSEAIYGYSELLEALHFAAEKHRDQRRKGSDASPYINHPIQAAQVLTTIGQVDDVAVLQAAILHDTVEDTETSFEELEALFGKDVRQLVEEVTDDKALEKSERKRLQVEHTKHISDRAKLIKLADKICNVGDVTHDPPAKWPLERRVDYLDWTEQVVAGCRGVNAALEAHYDELIQLGRKQLSD